MFNDKVREVIARRGLRSFSVVEEKRQPKPASPEAQKLFREARVFRARAEDLDNQAAIVHGNKRRMKLRREARVAHELADRYVEEAEAIAHYGRPGMKWGVRRSKKQLSAASKAGTSTKKIKKQAKKMTNEELQTRVKRMNLEKQYVSLSKGANAKTQSRMQRGKKEMASIAKASVKKAVKDVATAELKRVMTNELKKRRESAGG